MKGILANLLIKLGLDSKEFEQGIGKAKKDTNTFASSIKDLGKLFAGVFAVSTIVAFAKNVLALAKESIQIENELGAAIRANGKDVNSTLSDYKSFAQELQNVTTLEDDAILSLIRLAETLQSDAPKEAAKNAIALSKALGVDLNTAVKMAVMAQSDMYTMLGRYVPALREAGTTAERTTEYNKLLASGMSILAAETQTAAGKAEQLRVKWDNIKEGWGVAVLSSETLSESLSKLSSSTDVLFSKNLSFWEKVMAFTDVTGGNMAAMVQKEGDINAMKERQKKFNDGLIAQQNIGKKQTTEKILTEEELAEIEKKRLEYLNKQNDAYNLQLDLINTIADSQGKSLKSVTDKYDPNKGLSSDDSSFAGMFDMADEQEDPVIEKWLEKNKKSLENFASFKQEFAYMVEDFSIEVVDQLGMAFGEMLKTGDFPDDFGQNILAIIGGFISQLGKMLIGLGVASEAFKDLLATSFLGGGVGLIVAGAALVLLGGAIKGFAKSGPSGGGGGGGASISQPSYSRANPGATAQTSRGQSVVFEIDGTKLKGVLNNVDRKYTLVR